MRHARRHLGLAALIILALLPAEAPAQKPQTRMNAIGLIDFTAKPPLKVGSWARYHMQAKSELGVVDDYTLTVLIAGEEHWWGEDCFWIETWTETATGASQAVASLMSYDIFQDSLAMPHLQLYVRKVINGMNPDGTPLEEVYKRPAATLKQREPLESQFKTDIDSLGAERITVPKGEFDCRKVQFFQGRSQTGSKGDSTDYTELRETRTVFMNDAIPITHIVREDIEQVFTRRAWMVGYSKQATPTVTLDRTRGTAELVGFGTSGQTARVIPANHRKSLDEQRAEAAKATKAAPKSATKTPAKPAAKSAAKPKTSG
jgi:hypothetical protein